MNIDFYCAQGFSIAYPCDAQEFPIPKIIKWLRRAGRVFYPVSGDMGPISIPVCSRIGPVNKAQSIKQ